ncbi:4'-phosphopantetheinyl transferase family protein [Oerskovia turbata]
MPDDFTRTLAGILVVTGIPAGSSRPEGVREAAEREVSRARMSPDRHDAYLRGRDAAHRALAVWLPKAVHDRTEVLRGPLGQPVATRDGADVAEVSIAHCPGWAAAVASERGRPVGVDIEPRRGDSVGPAWRAASSEQMALAVGAGLLPETASLLLWTVREAAGKALRTGLMVASDVLDVAAVERVDEATYGIRFRSLMAMKGVTRVVDDAVVSLATLGGRAERLHLTNALPKTCTGGHAWGLAVREPARTWSELANSGP